MASSIYTQKFMSYRILEFATFNIQKIRQNEYFFPIVKIYIFIFYDSVKKKAKKF